MVQVEAYTTVATVLVNQQNSPATNVNFKTNVTHRTRGMPTKTQKTWTMVRTVVLVEQVHLLRTAPYVIAIVKIMFKRLTVIGVVVQRPTGALDGTVAWKVSCVHRVQSEQVPMIIVVWEARGNLGHVLAVLIAGSMVSTLWEMLL